MAKNGENTRRLLYMLGDEIVELLRIIEDMELPDAWIAGGYIRNRVWNELHGYNRPQNDVDVIFFDPSIPRDHTVEYETEIWRIVKDLHTGYDWQFKNQAWTHLHKGDQPYEDSFEAIRRFPETATAVACQMVDYNSVRVAAPHGLDDLFGLVIRPSPGFRQGEPLHSMFINRVYRRTWLQEWPDLRVKKR